MRFKKTIGLMLSAAMALSLTACGGGNSSNDSVNSTTTATASAETTAAQGGQEANQGSGDEAVTINFYAWSDEEGIFTKLADAYMANHPNVTIKLQFIPSNDYMTKLLTVFSGGGDIDCFGVSSPPSLAQVQAKGSVMALDDLISSNKTDTSGYAGTLESIAIDGKTYALPYKTSSWVVYYNKDIFDAAGVPYPDGEWTWEEYYDIAGKLTSGEGANKIYGSLNFQPTSLWWRVPANSKGSTNPLNDDELHDWMKAAEFCKSLSDAGYQPPYEDMASEAGADYTGNFLQGKYGMYFTGDWGVEMLNTSIANGDGDVKYDIAPLPHWEGEDAATPGAPGLLMVAQNAKNPDVAYDFISYCAGAEGADLLLDNDYFPAWQSDETIATYTEGKSAPEHIEYIVNQKIISQVPCDEYYNSVTNIIKEEISLYLIGEQDIETAEANSKKRMQDEVLNAQ
ncbi:MAG: sugar ABC transporter substrate-binding protein [Hungatella sp.]|nr:sugar ABC transporter substrate-binding protein [Hungatella sp.]